MVTDALQRALQRALELAWHPVCTLEELSAAAPHPLAVRLLGRDLAVADFGTAGVAALVDRCLHRSTRLSVGWVEQSSIRCAYHGWRWAADGRCVEIPAVPDAPIPSRACAESFQAEIAYGLVWVRIDGSAATVIPPHPGWNDKTMKVVPGRPYTWPTSAPRRVENFVDVSHFAWVHDGSLGRRDEPVPPLPEVRREDGELRFDYDPPSMDVQATALFGRSRYRMPMPLTVDIDFVLPTGARRRLWMTASPIDAASCRSFWSVCRDDDLDGDDAEHMAFQDLVLAEDEPVVCNQSPPELILERGFELDVRTDRVSIEYRRWLRDLADAAAISAEVFRATLYTRGQYELRGIPAAATQS
jgi:phenylpropionate dioxygenase-like ring-hydroxylating dioxygenase large terminal subunit